MLADEIAELKNTRAHRGCVVGFVLEQFEEKDRKALADLIDRTQVDTTKISRLLAKHGHIVAPARLRQHRRRVTSPESDSCSCRVEL